jgi:transposase
MADRITYVGLDVRKESIVVAAAPVGPRGEAGVRPDRDGVGPSAAQASRRRYTLRFCYEAGPCGYGIHRRLSTILNAMLARAQMWNPVGATAVA